MSKKEKYLRSPLFYVGDKYKLLQYIKPLFPQKVGRFIEPFTGGGSVFLNINADAYFLNDINTHIVGLHQFLANQTKRKADFFLEIEKQIKEYGFSRSYLEDVVPLELKKAHIKTYYARYNKAAYEQLRADYNAGQKDFLTLYLLLIFGFNRMLRFNSKGLFNLPVGNVDFNKNVKRALDDYCDIMPHLNIEWFNQDYKHFIQSFDYQEDDFVYFDPPYLLTFSEYNKIWNEEKEIEMIELLNKLNEEGVKFAVSNVTHYKGKINHKFAEWSEQFKVHPIKSNYISYHDNSIKKFREVLVCNY